MNKLINKDNEWIIHFMGSLDRLLDNVEHLTANYRPTLDGERFFTDKEVSARLKVSRRTLQDYRNEGRIAYIQLGGKILYRESDIERMLNDGYRSAQKQKSGCKWLQLKVTSLSHQEDMKSIIRAIHKKTISICTA